MQNKINVIKLLYFTGEMSCADLCKILDKSLPNMAKILEDLIEMRIVTETGYATSSGGRRALKYSLVQDRFYIISVSMDQLFTRIALYNIKNELVLPIEKIKLTLKDNDQALVQLSNSLEQFVLKSKIDKSKILGIGIGMPGFIDVKKGENYSFLLNNGNSVNIIEHISNRLELPVYIDNDSSLIALAENRFGIGKMKKNILVINMGWGVGLGIIINGQLYRGENGFAGEFSHIPLFTNNKLCSCGKFGCLETETSLLVLIEKAKEAIIGGRGSKIRNISFESEEFAYSQIIKYAIEGDSLAVELLSEIGYKIGRGISILIHLLNPELIVLSGKGTIAGHLWVTPIQQALNEFCIPRLATNTKIKVSDLGFDAEQIGAATLVVENLSAKNLENKVLLKTA